MPRHCATCSRSEADAKFYGEFCEFCTRERLAKTLPDSVQLKECKRCNRIWTGTGFAAPTKRAVEAALALRIKGYSIRLIDYAPTAIRVELSRELGDGAIALEKELKPRWERTVCADCHRRAGGYWEACIQLRGGDARVAKAEERISRYIAHSGAFLTKSEDAPNGIDMYISNKKAVNEMLLYFHMKAVMTYTLCGLKSGRRVYRNTYAIHL